jgi:hypothetical protein
MRPFSAGNRIQLIVTQLITYLRLNIGTRLFNRDVIALLVCKRDNNANPAE